MCACENVPYLKVRSYSSRESLFINRVHYIIYPVKEELVYLFVVVGSSKCDRSMYHKKYDVYMFSCIYTSQTAKTHFQTIKRSDLSLFVLHQ